MTSRITLPFWPAALDCLKWSHDGLIAVGGGDRIAILTPRLHKTGPNNAHWDTCTLSASTFTTQEVPLLKQPLSSANFSLGEEVSLRHVQSLEWSPPGLAKYRRSALAVLNSNHVLCIWECVGKLAVSSDWQRVCIINNVLRNHFSELDRQKYNSATGSPESQEEFEENQIKQRIRAFAWSPLLYENHSHDDSTPLSQPGRGHQLLAISTEAGEVLLLQVCAPHDMTVLRIDNWQVRVVCKFNLGTLGPTMQYNGISDEHNGHGVRGTVIADSLAWGHWNLEQSSITAPLAFVARRQLFAIHVTGEVDGSLVKAELRLEACLSNLSPSSTDVATLLKTCPADNHVISFCPDRIMCVPLHDMRQNRNVMSTHHLDGRWDEMSGITFVCENSGVLQVHIVSHLSSASAETNILEIPSLQGTVPERPAWQDAIWDGRVAFSAEHGLGGQVQERVWGIAASPLEDYVAICMSMHPSDVLAYVTGSEQRCVVDITATVDSIFELGVQADRQPRASECASAEVVLFSAQRYFEEIALRDEIDTPTRVELTETMAMIMATKPAPPSFESEMVLAESYNSEQIIWYLRNQLYSPPDVIRARCGVLAGIALNETVKTGGDVRQIVQHLITEIIELPSRCFEDSGFCTEVIRLYRIIANRLESDAVAGGDAETNGDWSEQCTLCKQPMPFESVKWARCPQGHHFARCGVTFFALQEPGQSKSCAICGVQYLHEAIVRDSETRSTLDLENTIGQADSPLSLGCLLLTACDRCLYCGGNFN